MSNFGLKTNYKAELPNNRLLSPLDFPNTSNLYVWPINGVGSFSGASSFGGVNLNGVGGITAQPNHLDTTVYNKFDGGTAAAYAPGTDFDTANESFTCGGWFYFNSVAGQTIMSKYGAAAADQSWYVNINTNGSVVFSYSYSSGNWYTALSSPGTISGVGMWYHIAVTYVYNNYTNIYVNGQFVAQGPGSTRINTANSKLTFGAYGNGSFAGGGHNGRIADVYYKKSGLSMHETRPMYVAGSKLLAYYDSHNAKVKIAGEIIQPTRHTVDLVNTAGFIPNRGGEINPGGIVSAEKGTDGRWWVEFHVAYSHSVAHASPSFGVGGITGNLFLPANVNGYEIKSVPQGMTSYASNNPMHYCSIASNGYCYGGSSPSSTGPFYWYARVPVTNKPSWALDFASMY